VVNADSQEESWLEYRYKIDVLAIYFAIPLFFMVKY